LATRMAEKVKRTGKPATIDPMNAHDRRIVHIALKDDSKVRTQSVGEGFLRKLVILPKKNSYRKKRSN
ncbi:MAG: RNA-binding protein, partial [Desulfobacterales bacterium]